MQKGFKHSEETKEKIRMIRLGTKRPFKRRKEPITKDCGYCGITFQHKPCWGDRKKYCSKKCFNATISDRMYRTGGPNWKGGNNKCVDCKIELSDRYGKRCQECFHKYAKGETHGSWRGGITSLNHKIRSSTAMKEWRKAVFKRDDYTCQACGDRGDELHADHVLPFAFFHDLRLEVLNGRTLCVDCHQKTDTYGKMIKTHPFIFGGITETP